MQNQPTPEAPVQVKAHFVPKVGGGTLHLCTTTGDYLGTIEFDAATPQALLPLANWFQSWAAQQAGGIQIVPGLGLAGVRT